MRSYTSLKQYFWKKYICHKYKVTFYKGTIINRNSIFGGNNAIYNNTEYVNSSLGFGSYVANNSVIRGAKIGKYCSIGDNVRTGLGRHPVKDYVSTHPAFFSMNKQAGFTYVEAQKYKEHKYVDKDGKYYIEIGSDVWIGNNVMIMDGVKIGDGAIVGLGSIVTKDIEPYSINVGIPAKKIKYRFEKKYIEFLLEFKWWDKDFEWLNENAYLFDDIKEFYRKFGPNANNND